MGRSKISIPNAPSYGNFTNNDYNLCAKFDIDITKWLPKTIVWDDSVTTPTSKMVYVVIEATGTAAAGVYSATNQIAAAIHLSYTDA